jgi:hypothetical protein
MMTSCRTLGSLMLLLHAGVLLLRQKVSQVLHALQQLTWGR